MPPPSGRTGAAGVALGDGLGAEGDAGVIGVAGEAAGALGTAGDVGATAGVGMDEPAVPIDESITVPLITVPQPQPVTGVPQQLIPQPVEHVSKPLPQPQPAFQP